MNRTLMGDEWFEFMKDELNQTYFFTLKERVREEYKRYQVCPAAIAIFRAFQLTPPDKVKVIIIGQDPYPFNNDATGLAFSTNNPTTPYSLKMIFRELDRDIVRTTNISEFLQHFPDNDLTPWAKEGVFLLNTVLTVRANETNSHKDLGWQEFTSAVIKKLHEDQRPKVFIAWGAEAQKLLKGYTWETHLLLESGHPASGSHGKDKFSGNLNFSKANNWLVKQGIPPVNWVLK